MYRIRLSTLRIKTCAALNGTVESTVPDRRAVPEAGACTAAVPGAANPLPAKTPYAIARVIIDRMTSLDGVAMCDWVMVVPRGDTCISYGTDGRFPSREPPRAPPRFDRRSTGLPRAAGPDRRNRLSETAAGPPQQAP